MDAKAIAVLCAVAAASAAAAATVEAEAVFALDNVRAEKTVRSGEAVRCVRDAAWADGGVTFSMTGAADQTLTEGLAETITAPDVPHYRRLTLGLTAGNETYSWTCFVVNGEPNARAETEAAFALDAQTGAVRKAGDCERLAYSDRWADGASGPSLSVVKPDGTTEAFAVSGEGAYLWAVDAPYVRPRLAPGRYVFTHADGVDTLTATFQVASVGFQIFIR